MNSIQENELIPQISLRKPIRARTNSPIINLAPIDDIVPADETLIREVPIGRAIAVDNPIDETIVHEDPLSETLTTRNPQ
jgi:hypothetical protein